MSRKPFSQVLKEASIDLRREYDRLYFLFFLQRIQDSSGNSLTLREYCASTFLQLPFRGTCVTLDDFDDYYEYHFEKAPSAFSIDTLVTLCEYSYNLAVYNQGINPTILSYGLAPLSQAVQFYVNQVNIVIENMGYMPNVQGCITDFVPKDQAAIAVAEVVDSNLSYKVIEYNHHSMKGDLERKKSILLALADKLEPQRSKLNSVNSPLESDLFYLLNTVNVRHNNSDPNGTKYVETVAKMKSKEIEKWYDDIYQMCLLAFMELDNVGRKGRVKELKKRISEQ